MKNSRMNKRQKRNKVIITKIHSNYFNGILMLINNLSAPYRVEINCDHSDDKTPSLCGSMKIQNGDQIIETCCLLAVHMPEMGKDIHIHQDKIITDIEQPSDSCENASADKIQTWQRNEKKAELTQKFNGLQAQMTALVNEQTDIYDELSLDLRESLSALTQEMETKHERLSIIDRLQTRLQKNMKIRAFVLRNPTYFE